MTITFFLKKHMETMITVQGVSQAIQGRKTIYRKILGEDMATDEVDQERTRRSESMTGKCHSAEENSEEIDSKQCVTLEVIHLDTNDGLHTASIEKTKQHGMREELPNT